MSKIDDPCEVARDALSKFRIGVLGQRVIDFWPVFAFKKPEIIISCEGGDDASTMAPGIALVSPELVNQRRMLWTNRSLADLAKVAREDLSHLSISPSNPLVLLAYCGTPEWEQFEEETGGAIRVIAPLAALKARLDDKIYTRSGLAARALPVPRSVIADEASTMDFDTLASSLGEPIMVQHPLGSAGIGTYSVASAFDLGCIAGFLPRGKLLVSSHVGNLTLNVHGLAAPDGVQVSRPSVQLTGVPALGNTPYGYCGNDFGAAETLAASVVERSQELTRLVGRWLMDEGYSGLYGVDLAVLGDVVSILEVNPRLQGSTWLLAALEARQGMVPLVVKHFAQLLGSPILAGEESLAPLAPLAPLAAQAILHSLAGERLRMSHSLESGVYEIDAHDQLHYRWPPPWPPVFSGREILVFGLPPKHGVVIDSGAVLARFACGQLLAQGDGRTLTAFGLSVVRAIRREFRVIGHDIASECT